MRLVVLSHKPCWPHPVAPSGYATDGGFPYQMAALSQLFSHTRVLVPVTRRPGTAGEIAISGHNVSVVPLHQRFGTGLASKISFFPWLLRNIRVCLREVRAADAVHAPIPGDIGTVGMLIAWALRKPLFVRHCGNWLRPRTIAEKFWRWFMERYAGGRNVMLATGGAAEPPSRSNPNVHWIFSSSLTRDELQAYATLRSYPRDQVRLVIVARQEPAKGAGRIIRSLPLLVSTFPSITLEIVGLGSGIPEFKRITQELGIVDRVIFAGKLNHEQVMERLRHADLFVFPTTSSDGFPKAVLEGLASGLPVVATRVSVLPQLLERGCGVIIDDASPQSVAQGIRDVLVSPETYETMSRQAISTARQYSLEAWRDTIGAHLTKAWGPLKSRDEAGNLKPENVLESVSP